MLALLALSAFVFDYGVMWVSRGQAQNCGRCGRLVGRDFARLQQSDRSGRRPRAGDSRWRRRTRSGARRRVSLDADVTFPACPPGIPGPQDNCVKVDVFRNQARGNPLPTFFGRLAGVMNQGVVATATAQVTTGDSTSCLRPWAVVDRWKEFGPEGRGCCRRRPTTSSRRRAGQQSAARRRTCIFRRRKGEGTGYQLPADRGRSSPSRSGPPGVTSFVRLVSDPRSSARRYDAAGKQHCSEQHPDLQRIAVQLCQPGHRVSRDDPEHLGRHGLLGGARLLSGADRRHGRVHAQFRRRPDRSRCRRALVERRASPEALPTRRRRVRASCRSA